MTNQRHFRTAWLFVKATAFTLIAPGSVAGWVPYLLIKDMPAAAIDVFGFSRLGVIFMLLGAALLLRSVFDFAFTGGGTPAPIDAPVKLVTSGPYRFTRNPMYVGVLTIIAGEALMYYSIRLLYYMLAVTLVFNIFIIFYEERVLRKQFGEAYDRYCKAVPRWLSLRITPVRSLD